MISASYDSCVGDVIVGMQCINLLTQVAPLLTLQFIYSFINIRGIH